MTDRVIMNNSKTEMLPDLVNFNKIEEGLYLGNLTSALDTNTLGALRISHILTIDSKPLPSNIRNLPGLHFHYINVDDMSYEDLLSHFPKIIDFITDGQEKGNVLVHCYFGVSRSACAVVAYLMNKYNLEVDAALERVKSKRRCVSPNSGFLSQLILYRNLDFKISTSKHLFRLYQLAAAGERFKRGGFYREGVSDIVYEKPISQEVRAYVKCRSCRTVLLYEDCIIPHQKGEIPKWHCVKYEKDIIQCNLGIFSLPCRWMTGISNAQGKILCPKCCQKVGSFNWIKGYSCPCSVVLSPGFFIIPSKVDLCPNQQHTCLT